MALAVPHMLHPVLARLGDADETRDALARAGCHALEEPRRDKNNAKRSSSPFESSGSVCCPQVRFACAGALESMASHRTCLARLFVFDAGEGEADVLERLLANPLDADPRRAERKRVDGREPPPLVDAVLARLASTLRFVFGRPGLDGVEEVPERRAKSFRPLEMQCFRAQRGALCTHLRRRLFEVGSSRRRAKLPRGRSRGVLWTRSRVLGAA